MHYKGNLFLRYEEFFIRNNLFRIKTESHGEIGDGFTFFLELEFKFDRGLVWQDRPVRQSLIFLIISSIAAIITKSFSFGKMITNLFLILLNEPKKNIHVKFTVSF